MIAFTDRYRTLGIPYPDTTTVCDGHCEGTGYIPVYDVRGNLRSGESLTLSEEKDPRLQKLWDEAHAEAHTWSFRIALMFTIGSISCLWKKCDGWHFVKCPDCDGTGKRKP